MLLIVSLSYSCGARSLFRYRPTVNLSHSSCPKNCKSSKIYRDMMWKLGAFFSLLLKFIDIRHHPTIRQCIRTFNKILINVDRKSIFSGFDWIFLSLSDVKQSVREKNSRKTAKLIIIIHSFRRAAASAPCRRSLCFFFVLGALMALSARFHWQ